MICPKSLRVIRDLGSEFRFLNTGPTSVRSTLSQKVWVPRASAVGRDLLKYRDVVGIAVGLSGKGYWDVGTTLLNGFTS